MIYEVTMTIPALNWWDRWLTCSASDCLMFSISSRRRRSSSTCWRTAPWCDDNSPRLNSCRLTPTSQSGARVTKYLKIYRKIVTSPIVNIEVLFYIYIYIYIYIYLQSTTGRCQPDIIKRIGIALLPCTLMNSLATDLASTADKTSPVPDLYTVHFVWFRDVDTSAGGSTETGGLSHPLPTYDPRDTLAWLCQKHRSCRPDQPSLCSGCRRQETKLTVRPCGETRWPHASPPRIITGRSSKNWPPLWSWLVVTARTPAPFMDPADRRCYTLQHSCWMV